MSRPKPLSNPATGRSYYPEQLTPRTPHSRSGRFSDVDLDDLQGESSDDNQRVPLLAEKDSEIPTSEPAGREKSMLGRVLSSIPPVVGSCLAFILLVMIVISLRAPDSLQRFVGVSTERQTVPSRPLHPSQYRTQCAKFNAAMKHHGNYWDPPMGNMNHSAPQGGTGSDTCNSTITYMLDGRVGLFADLALLAQVAAMARERNRTLFVDDTYWNRGRWTDYFKDVKETQPGPEPGCIPPLTEDLVACPRSTRHWVISSQTAKYHLGHPFEMNYEDAYGHSLNRAKPIFDVASLSLNSTIRPNAELTKLIQSARQELGTLTSSHANKSGYVGIHLRRGDRLAVSWKYHTGYVPIVDFAQALKDTYEKLSLASPAVYIASDSPQSLKSLQSAIIDFDSPTFTTFSLAQSNDAKLRQLASPKDYDQRAFNETSEPERILATKGVVVDFALLSGAWEDSSLATPGAVICTFSSNICKMSAVALGWDRAFGDVPQSGLMGPLHRWVEIDLHGDVEPAWEAFEMF